MAAATPGGARPPSRRAGDRGRTATAYPSLVVLIPLAAVVAESTTASLARSAGSATAGCARTTSQVLEDEDDGAIQA